MPSGSFKVDLKDLHYRFNKFKKTLDDPSGVFDKTISDMTRRAPGKVADAVRSTYNIKKADIMPSKQKRDLKKAGSLRITGDSVATFKIFYEGRVLTPLHFGLTPKEKPNKKKYKLSLKIKKMKKNVSSPTKEGKVPFLAPARKGNARILPWLRDADGSIEPMKTLSLPQMVDNPQVREVMTQDLGELMHARFNHHMDRYLGDAVK